MISSNRLSIQDYLQRAGISADRRAVPPAGNGFSKLLKSLQSPEQSPSMPSKGGMQISDYRQRPINARISAMAPPSARDGAEVPALDEQSPLADVPGQLPEPSGGSGPLASLPETEAAQPSEAEQIYAGIQSAAAKYDLPPALIHSVIRVESNFQPQAVSRAGALGLMQLMPTTADELGVADPMDIAQNIDGGARYLRRMLDRFDGDLNQALMAYNAGPGTVARYNGKVPYVETRHYVQKVLHYARQYRV